MSDEKPSWEQYPDWAEDRFGSRFNEGAFNRDVMAVKGSFLDSPFWGSLSERIKAVCRNYEQEKGHQLITHPEFQTPNLLVKSFESALDKSYRKNVHWNKAWPEPPETGWVTPENIVEKLNDTVRTTIVSRFLDGPQFLAEALKGHADSHELGSEYYSQQKEVGYYAYHFYVEFPTSDLGTLPDHVQIEIQLTTDMQSMLKSFTHRYYADERLEDESEEEDAWQWQPGTSRFKARYLSHTLHMLEGTILELRDEEQENE